MSEFQKEFEKIAREVGLPMSEEEAKTLWQQKAQEAGSPFNNDSDYSPFWRTVLELVTKPLLWLVNDYFIQRIFPSFFVKTAKGRFLEALGWAVELPPKEATTALGSLVFSRLLTAGDITIPQGTRITSPAINGVVYTLQTTADAVLVDGQQQVNVLVEATAPGAAFNLAAGYYAIMAQPIPGIDAVKNLDSWLTRAGADREDDDDYRLRIRNQYTAVNQYHTDAVYRKIITSFANIETRNVFFEHGAPRGPGTANAFILMDVGEPGDTMLAQIQAHIMGNGNHGHGDDLRVFAMPSTLHDLVVTVVPQNDIGVENVETLRDQVTSAVRAAFHENAAYAMTTGQPFSNFSFSKLGAELHSYFPQLESVRFSLGDIQSGLNVPRLRSLQVLVDD